MRNFEQFPIKERLTPEEKEKNLTPEEQKMRDLERDMNNGMESFMPERKEPKKAERDEQALEKSIESAKTIDDLIETFRNTDGIKGSSKFYSSEEIIKLLEFTRDGNPDLVIGAITRSLGLRGKVKEILAREKAEMEELQADLGGMESIAPEKKEKSGKAIETEKQLKAIEVDLKNSQSTLERIQDSAGKKDKIAALQDRIVYLENKKLELKDELDILKGKEITLEKIKMKAGEGSEVQRGKKFNGICQEEISIGGIANIFSPKIRQGLKTSRIESIKACPDGSYIVETNTSFYRLNIAA